MSAGGWAVVVAVVAVVVSAVAAWYTTQKSRETATAGFRAGEDIKADLVALIAALRSLILKGIQSSQDDEYLDVQADLEAVRRFQTSGSGLGLSLLAAERGSTSEPMSGNWRVLGLNMANLTGIALTDQATGATNLKCRELATDIEQTLSQITQTDVNWVTSRMRKLDALVTTLVDTRGKDFILAIWFQIYARNKVQADPAKYLAELEQLESAGVDDPDLRLWLAILRDQPDKGERALKEGASRATSVNELLQRHADVLKTS
jgi:hypothetical protein